MGHQTFPIVLGRQPTHGATCPLVVICQEEWDEILPHANPASFPETQTSQKKTFPFDKGSHEASSASAQRA